MVNKGPLVGVRRVFALALALALGALGAGGCAMPAGVAPPPPPTIVKVPVAEPVYCPSPARSRPALAIASLTPASSPADTVRAYAATVIVLKAAVAERDRILDGCTRAAPAVAPAPARATAAAHNH